MTKRRFIFFIASLLSGLLLWQSFPPNIGCTSFVGFWGILMIEDELGKQNLRWSKLIFFGWSYFALLVWNVLSTWWVCLASTEGGILALAANPLLMTIPLIAFHTTKKRFGKIWGYISLRAYWIAFEFLHHRWQLAWPWLTLGNSLAQFPNMIQWYSFTGVLGGSLWILSMNIICFLGLKKIIVSGKNWHSVISIVPLFLLIVIPISSSNLISHFKTDDGKKISVALIQPNIDPYNTKFDLATIDMQVDTLIHLSERICDSTTDYVIWPETAIPQGVWLNKLESNNSIKRIRAFLSQYPKLKLVTGISAYQHYDAHETSTAREDKYSGGWWDSFNSMLQLDSSSHWQVYHKSKLVPGVECIPYTDVFPFFQKLVIDLGGTTGTLGTQPHRTVFSSGKDSIKIAPIICYESIYGDYVTEYVRLGAQVLAIGTNDGWWGNTDGYKQHMQYARLRAIENHRWVLRSANTGISCFIAPDGTVFQATDWWKAAAIKQDVVLHSDLTFYAHYGDWLGWIALITSFVFLLWNGIEFIRTKRTLRKS